LQNNKPYRHEKERSEEKGTGEVSFENFNLKIIFTSSFQSEGLELDSFVWVG
jgi:hypothetical protein